jgi:hypothetical protein
MLDAVNKLHLALGIRALLPLRRVDIAQDGISGSAATTSAQMSDILSNIFHGNEPCFEDSAMARIVVKT